MRSAINASVVLELTTEGERLIHHGIIRGKKERFISLNVKHHLQKESAKKYRPRSTNISV